MFADGVATYYLEGRTRKGDHEKADVLHGCETCELLLDVMHECDGTLLTAAKLHDVVEDAGKEGTIHGPYSIADLEADFGEEIAFLVDAKTKISDETVEISAVLAQIEKRLSQIPHSIQTLLRRYQKEIAAHPGEKHLISSQIKLILYSLIDPRVILLAAADRGCVLHEKGLTRQKYKEKGEATLQYLYPPAYLFGCMLAARRLSNEAFRRVEEASPNNQYERLLRIRHETREKYAGLLQTLEDGIRLAAQKHPHGTVKILKIRRTFRTPYEMHLIEKHHEAETGKPSPINPDQDIMMLQIIVQEDTACSDIIFDIVHRLNISDIEIHPCDGRIQDRVADANLNGYQSMHTAIQVITPQGTVIVKVIARTEPMHEVAERGLMATAYHAGKFTPPNLPWLNSPYLWELLDPSHSPEGRFDILAQLTEASKVTVVTVGNHVPNSVSTILPPGKTAREVAFIVGGGDTGMHLAPEGNRFGATIIPSAAIDTQVSGKKPGMITLATQAELIFGDHLAHMQDPVARRHLREWLEAQEPIIRQRYAEAAMTEALKPYHLSLSDWQELVPQILTERTTPAMLWERVCSGTVSAEEIVADLIRFDRITNSPDSHTPEVEIEFVVYYFSNTKRGEVDAINDTGNALRLILCPETSRVPYSAASNITADDTLFLSVTTSVKSALQRRRVENFIKHVNQGGLGYPATAAISDMDG